MTIKLEGDPFDECTVTHTGADGEDTEISINLDPDLEVASIFVPADTPPEVLLAAFKAWQLEVVSRVG